MRYGNRSTPFFDRARILTVLVLSTIARYLSVSTLAHERDARTSSFECIIWVPLGSLCGVLMSFALIGIKAVSNSGDGVLLKAVQSSGLA